MYKFLETITKLEQRLLTESDITNFKVDILKNIQDLEEKLLLGANLPKEFSKNVYILKKGLAQGDLRDLATVIRDLKILARGFFSSKKDGQLFSQIF